MPTADKKLKVRLTKAGNLMIAPAKGWYKLVSEKADGSGIAAASRLLGILGTPFFLAALPITVVGGTGWAIGSLCYYPCDLVSSRNGREAKEQPNVKGHDSSYSDNCIYCKKESEPADKKKGFTLLNALQGKNGNLEPQNKSPEKKEERVCNPQGLSL